MQSVFVPPAQTVQINCLTNKEEATNWLFSFVKQMLYMRKKTKAQINKIITKLLLSSEIALHTVCS